MVSHPKEAGMAAAETKKRTSWIALAALSAVGVLVIVVFYNVITQQTDSMVQAAEANNRAPIFHR
jgi:hypothetical protein